MAKKTPPETKKPSQVDKLLAYSKPFNPKDDAEAAENGFTFTKLAPGDREYRIGVLLFAGVLCLRSIERRLREMDQTGLDVRDDLRAAADQLVAVMVRSVSDQREAEDDEGQGEEDDEEDDTDQDDDDQAYDDQADDGEPEP